MCPGVVKPFPSRQTPFIDVAGSVEKTHRTLGMGASNDTRTCICPTHPAIHAGLHTRDEH